MKKIVLLFSIAAVIASTSCEEDELKLPAEVNISFDMNSFTLGDDTKAAPLFTIDEGYIIINTIEFDGEREQGDDYFFTNTFEELLQAEMHTGNINQDVSFDIPQGVYYKVEFNFIVGDEEYPALRLRGISNDPVLGDIPVLFEYPFVEEIQIEATNINGKKEIVLRKDRPSTATIILDIPLLCKLFNPGMIQQAELVSIEGEDVLLINNETNTNIFLHD